MKSAPLLLGFCLVTSGLFGVAPHPCVLTAKYKGQMLPVVRVHNSEAYVLFEGKEKLIRSDPEYALQDAPGFGGGYVDSTGGREGLGGPVMFEGLNGDLGAPFSARGFDTWFYTKLTSKQTLKGGYAAVVIYAAGGFSNPNPAAARPVVTVHALPDLPAGQPVEVTFAGAGIHFSNQSIYFIQIFDATGREVMTRDIEWAWEYYTLRERARLALAVQKYREKFAGADHDAVPAIMPKPIFAPGSVPPSQGLSALLTVTESGQVVGVEIEGSQDAEVNKSLTAALEGWLFLPKLKAGQPVPVKIQLPLKF